MSRREFDTSLGDVIFGAQIPNSSDVAATPGFEPVIDRAVPEVAGESSLHAVLPGHEDKPIFVYRPTPEHPNGRKVVRIYPSRPAGNPSANEPARPVVDTLHPSPTAPVSSKLSFNLERDTTGIFGDFRVEGDIASLLGSFAGVAAARNRQPAPDRQLENRPTPAESAQPGVVDSIPLAPKENRPNKADDHDLSSNVARTVATRGLKKVIRGVLRPRFGSAVLVLSAVTAGGAYHAASGGDNIIQLNPKDTIAVIQADYNQLVEQPIQTLTAQFGRP
jgi:hypothetical protein